MTFCLTVPSSSSLPSAPWTLVVSHMLEMWMVWTNVRNSDFSLRYTKLCGFTALRSRSGHGLVSRKNVHYLLICSGTVCLYLKHSTFQVALSTHVIGDSNFSRNGLNEINCFSENKKMCTLQGFWFAVTVENMSAFSLQNISRFDGR